MVKMLVAAAAALLLLAAAPTSAQCNPGTCGGAVFLNATPGAGNATYGWYVRSNGSGPGQNLWNGWANYTGMYVWNPGLPGTGLIGSAVNGIAANGDRNFGSTWRATTYKAGATNIASAAWAYNEDTSGNPSGVVVGYYGRLSDLPKTKAELDAEIGTRSSLAIFDSGDTPGFAALVARVDGHESLVVDDSGVYVKPLPVAQPTCDAAHRFAIWAVESGPGVADRLEVCGKDQGDNYVWKPVAIF